MQLLRQMQNMVAHVQMEAMAWAHITMSKYLMPNSKAYTYYIRKLLFLEGLNQYYYGGEVHAYGTSKKLTHSINIIRRPLEIWRGSRLD